MMGRGTWSGLVVACVLVVFAPAQGMAQDAATLADIRADLARLSSEVSQLRSELSSGTAGSAVDPGQAQFGIGGSVLERADRIEAQLTRLTGLTETLEFRINSIVTDATNRIGDLEFRLVELEGGDVSRLGQAAPLGGSAGTTAPALPEPSGTTGPVSDGAGSPELASGERQAFDAARTAFEAGDHAAAIDGFRAFFSTYPGSPLSVDAGFMKAESHTALNSPSDAARAYLDAFTAAPDGPRAATALLRLGVNLNGLGQVEEACIMFDELGLRFPGSAEAADAQARMAELSCS